MGLLGNIDNKTIFDEFSRCEDSDSAGVFRILRPNFGCLINRLGDTHC